MGIRVEEPGIVSGVAGSVDNLEGAAGDSADGEDVEDTGVASGAASGAIVRSPDIPSEPREALTVSTPPRVAATEEQKSPRLGTGARKRARRAMERAAAAGRAT